MSEIPKALTIAGTDPSGGAGIQADLKTFHALNVYGMSVITSVVSQNTLGVKTLMDMSPELVDSQMDAVFEDIRPQAVKIGMLSQSQTIQQVVHKIKAYDIDNVVVDPVMVAKSGDALLKKDAERVLIKELLPVSTVITPNISEAEVIVGSQILNQDDMKNAARTIVETYGAKAAIVKGGHIGDDAEDILYDGTGYETYRSPRTQTKHTHGTGCTFSSALAAELAKGFSLRDAVQTAKAFITAAISQPIAIGKGNGPVNHWAYQNQ